MLLLECWRLVDVIGINHAHHRSEWFARRLQWNPLTTTGVTSPSGEGCQLILLMCILYFYTHADRNKCLAVWVSLVTCYDIRYVISFHQNFLWTWYVSRIVVYVTVIWESIAALYYFFIVSSPQFNNFSQIIINDVLICLIWNCLFWLIHKKWQTIEDDNGDNETRTAIEW